MKINSLVHHRKSIRLPDYDYSLPGAYFITINTHEREHLFGRIHDGAMDLSEAGQVVWDVWKSLPIRYPQISIGTASVMPDHFHGIVNIIARIPSPVRAVHEPPVREKAFTQAERRRMTLPLVVGYFKMNTARRINLIRGSDGVPVWQRNYYERIIRDHTEYNRVHLYIEANVQNWSKDDHSLPGEI